MRHQLILFSWLTLTEWAGSYGLCDVQIKTQECCKVVGIAIHANCIAIRIAWQVSRYIDASMNRADSTVSLINKFMNFPLHTISEWAFFYSIVLNTTSLTLRCSHSNKTDALSGQCIVAWLSTVTGVCKACNFHLYRLSSIRRYITTDAARSVVQALITSRLDYCNSLLANLTNTQMKRLKSIQHKAARLVTRTPLREHITPVLKQLHWLPVECRITYKLMVLGPYSWVGHKALWPVITPMIEHTATTSYSWARKDLSYITVTVTTLGPNTPRYNAGPSCATSQSHQWLPNTSCYYS